MRNANKFLWIVNVKRVVVAQHPELVQLIRRFRQNLPLSRRWDTGDSTCHVHQLHPILFPQL